ncbi:hypothetical protein [Aquimarina mytili]|uniref:Uncharacterized protein n=1 Tax=Aquimarina mytili TaxID=874423 RepID=A0A937A0T1_9FLAO|nr:hypothetical protein [Aquimarina mytili]MBL0684751.1 hypothetical protein [Aquimarina mytili]
MIQIFDNKQDLCYECWDNTGKVFFYYNQRGIDVICIEKTEFPKNFEQTESFKIIVGTLVDLMQAMKLTIITNCPWIKAYLRIYSKKVIS